MIFCNLHHHTTFSFKDGYGPVARHVQRAAELGYDCIAATEHGNVSSFFQLEKAARKAGIKPIFGLEAYTGSVLDEQDEARLYYDDQGEVQLLPARSQFKYHLTILAMDQSGYRSLNRVVTRSYLDFHYHPTVSGQSLADNRRGLVVLSGCSGSLLACTLLGGKGTPERLEPDMARAEEVILRFKDLHGDRYYLEVQPFHELPRSCVMNKSYAELSKVTGVPLVVTHDVHYPEMKDAEMQAILHAAGRGNHTVDDIMRSWNYEVPLTLPESDRALHSRLMMTGLTKREARNAIYTSRDIAESCNVTLPKAERLRYPIEDKDLQPWT